MSKPGFISIIRVSQKVKSINIKNDAHFYVPASNHSLTVSIDEKS